MVFIMLIMLAYSSWEVAGPYGGIVRAPLQSQTNPDELWALAGDFPANVLHSVDGGLSWDVISSSITTDNAYEIVDTGNGNLVVVGNNRSWTSLDGGVTWGTRKVYGAHMPYAVAHPSNPGELYATGRAIIGGGYQPAVMHSTDNGYTFTKVALPSPITPRSARGYSIAISKSNPSIIFVAGGGYSNSKGYVPLMAISRDGGASFSEVKPPESSDDHYFCSVSIHPTNPSIFMAGSFNNMYRSTNSGSTWTKILSAGSVKISYSLANTDLILAARGTTLGRSTDGGRHWSGASGTVGEQVDWVVPSWKNSSIAFSSSSTGFLRSTNGGASWVASNTGLNIGNITAMIESEGWLYAFMENCGIYRVSISDPDPAKWKLVKATGTCENLCDFACDDAGNIMGLVGDG